MREDGIVGLINENAALRARVAELERELADKHESLKVFADKLIEAGMQHARAKEAAAWHIGASEPGSRFVAAIERDRDGRALPSIEHAPRGVPAESGSCRNLEHWLLVPSSAGIYAAE